MARSKQAFRVGISGSYGGLNLGDEAILQGIIKELRRALPVEITVFSREADDTRARHQVERVVAVRKLSRDEVLPEIQRLDLLILGGGGILFDGEAQVFLREVMLAHEHRVPVMVYAISAGPLKDAAAQAAVRDGLSRAAVVTVRERGARQALEDAGVHREILVTADPALLLEPQPLPKDALRREGLETRRQLVGMSVREPGVAAPEIGEQAYHKLLANAADFMVDRYDADVVFVPMERRMVDMQHAHAVDRADAARPARDGAEGRVHLGAAARADGPVRVRARHAPALPDLCELAGPALRRAALRPQGQRFSRRPGHRGAAARAGERRPADRLYRPGLGPPASAPKPHRSGAAGAAGARAENSDIAVRLLSQSVKRAGGKTKAAAS